MEKKYIFKSESLMLVIEPDIVGTYLIVYRDPSISVSDQDYLFDSLEETFNFAFDKFGVAQDKFHAIDFNTK
jgi:hypothetical protein